MNVSLLNVELRLMFNRNHLLLKDAYVTLVRSSMAALLNYLIGYLGPFGNVYGQPRGGLTSLFYVDTIAEANLC